ncbi:MAG TPA: chromate efflux transporter [Solirubrobacteraceae bacterium]|nr:chromate efflux transporter [Solirubrobacteraceae bacterium]
MTAEPTEPVGLGTVAREWTRIGLTGFGGPPAHIALLRRMVVDERGWIEPREFEEAIGACNLLPGPASTQLALFCAQRVAGTPGVLVGGLGFIGPAVVMMLILSALFLSQSPPLWVRGAGAGAGSAVAAVAVTAAMGLLRPSWSRVVRDRARRERWFVYVLVGGAAAATLGPYLVLVLLAAGLAELAVSSRMRARLQAHGWMVVLPLAAAAVGGIPALIWVAFKVGALSYGGGFVIIPLMQGDAVHTYHWMTSAQFLNAVALGQVTPGPVVATVAAVGYAAHGVGGGLLAAFVAFLPSFLFVLIGGRHFDRLRNNWRAQRFLDGAGPAAVGAIFGSAIPLAASLHEGWQFGLLAAAAVALLVGRLGIVTTLAACGVIGGIGAVAGAPIPH